MSPESRVLSDRWFTSPSLPPEDSPDLEKQCHCGVVENRETLWGRIWILLSLLFKTGTLAILSRASGNVSSKPNTRVSLNGPALDPLEDSTEFTQAQLDSPSMPSLENGIRVHSSQSSPTRDPSTLAVNDARLSCSTWREPDNASDEEVHSADLDDMISWFEESCGPPLAILRAPPPTPCSDRATAIVVDMSGAIQSLRRLQRDSITIPSSLLYLLGS